MAKSLKKGANVGKITFGKKKKGIYQKSKGPKDKNESKYIGQGR